MIESKFIKLFIIVVSLMILYGLILLFCMLLLKPYHFRMKKSYFKKQPYPKPYQQKIELFARSKSQGWDSWGYDVGTSSLDLL